MESETELQFRLRKAKESLEYAIDKESEARHALIRAEESRRAAKARYESLFLEEEKAEYDRRTINYRHCTL